MPGAPLMAALAAVVYALIAPVPRAPASTPTSSPTSTPTTTPAPIRAQIAGGGRPLHPSRPTGGAVPWPPPTPRTEPAVDLITVGPGPALFHRYGHAALCLFYARERPRSRCFNYGTANFTSPPRTIGWHFIRGTARFWVSVSPWPLIRATYTQQDRSIFAQRIPLSQAQVDGLVARLNRDLQPGRRSYRYHHFDDNCATRLRDHLDAVTGGRLREAGARGSGTTLRALGRRGIADRPLLIALADLTLGRRLDREATVWETMFLPSRLRAEVTRVLGARPVRLYQRQSTPMPPPPGHGGTGAVYLIGLGLLLGLPLVAARRLGRGERWAAGAAGLVLGLLGAALWALVIVTQVREMRINEVLLLLWPTDLALLGIGARRRRRYARVRLGGVALVLALRLVGVLRQPLYAAAAIPALPFAAQLWPWSARAQHTPESEPFDGG